MFFLDFEASNLAVFRRASSRRSRSLLGACSRKLRAESLRPCGRRLIAEPSS